MRNPPPQPDVLLAVKAQVTRPPGSMMLGDLLPMPDGFLAWFIGCATSPRTLQNRCMEIQRRRPDLGAGNDTRQQRERRSRAGTLR